ncbi:MAG: tRNA uridine-5-carboxymethylaminomethyl(34) synthesis GTPase MnmE [Saprospiraceae bacterium]|nr:tRNA uridine-5-carboxymethylaminomethyl(34) synthesis GTPase MnmE [Saprospiraceae bacterium]
MNALVRDTIAATITAPTMSAVGQIRVSGPDAIVVTQKFFEGRDLSKVEGHTLHFGKMVSSKGQTIDEVLISVFRAPHSYTGEDVVEISCHGSVYILQEVLSLLYSKGVRPAEAGEFTRRAWLNGKMDLSQAEAVADLISSETRAAHQLAINQLKGGIKNEIEDLRMALLDFVSLIELELDFAEEDVEFADRTKLLGLLDHISERIEKLLSSFQLGNAVRNGVQTVIAGRPNAGKSTLLNSLLGEDRALVSDIPGTTRDTVEEKLNIEGILFHLIDTAGLREAKNQVEAMGIQRSYEKIKKASILIYVYDSSELSLEEAQKDVSGMEADPDQRILIANKSDLIAQSGSNHAENLPDSFLQISARSGKGIEKLKKILLSKVLGSNTIHEDSIAINARHRNALEQASRDISIAREGIQTGLTTDLVAQNLRSVLHHLGEVSGQITNDEILGNIFGKFCIGK